MNILLRRRSTAALVVAALALTTAISGSLAVTQAAHATTAAKAKKAKACPLTDEERRGGTFWMTAPADALDFYPGTLYTVRGQSLEVGTQSSHFTVQPVGTLTVTTQRAKRTVVRFCANRDGSMRVVFPADTMTGPATITMRSRDNQDVFRKQFRVVVLNEMPAKPVSPTNVRAEVRTDGLLFTWTPTSTQPALEHYQFACGLPTVTNPQVFMPWNHMQLNMQPGGIVPLNIWTINVAGVSKLQTGWSYDPERRTVTRVY